MPASGGSSNTDAPMKSAGCGKPRSLMNGRIDIQAADGARSYILRAPDDYDGERAYRLVLAYHWSGGTANDVAGGGTTGGPYYGLWDQAEGSAIFVAPEGIDQGWSNPDGRDVAFTDAIVEQVANDLCIDTTRIFATGFSFGGAMSYALACARPDVFRAVAVYSAALLSGCEGGTEPVPYFAIRGVREPVINPVTTGRALRDHFAQVNGCTPQTPPEPAEGSGTHICTSYQGCTEGYPVRWCAFDDGHVASPKDQGQSTSWVPDEAWAFLEQF
jgi:poly(3-hydroxybutyrate) depolymerase